MAQSNSRLRLLAEPQSSYRERYTSELDPRRNRAQRFIRAETNSEGFDYPTVEILNEWRNRRLYIRVTLITVLSDTIPVICVHPYPIDTTEMNVIKDFERNTLYFQISDDDCNAGRKSFRIIRKKLAQYELRTYGQLRLLNKDERDIQRIPDPNDARKLIDLYQLTKSRLVFSLAELVYDNQYPVIYDATSAYSNIMNAIVSTTNDDDLSIRCVPQKGYWHGGDEILMVLPKADRRKTCKVIFEHPLMNNMDEIQIDFVDTKTIAFVTPPCPVEVIGNQNLQIPIVVIQGNEEIARVNFLYESSCKTNFMFDLYDESNTYEQSTTMNACFDIDDTYIFNPDSNNKSENDLSGN